MAPVGVRAYLKRVRADGTAITSHPVELGAFYFGVGKRQQAARLVGRLIGQINTIDGVAKSIKSNCRQRITCSICKLINLNRAPLPLGFLFGLSSMRSPEADATTLRPARIHYSSKWLVKRNRLIVGVVHVVRQARIVKRTRIAMMNSQS